MWNNLPLDILANIFSHLTPDSLARAKSACRSWYDTAESVPSPPVHHRDPWFLAFPTRSSSKQRLLSCYINNPVEHNWHVLPLDFIATPVKPVATVNGLVLLKLAGKTSLELAVCNPFTRQFRSLPSPSIRRTNPALGSIEAATGSAFKIYAAGGMSEAASGGGALYQPTVEVYDSSCGAWRVLGPMPVEFAVRLTVWTSSEGVFAGGVLYWITSARAYSVMGFEVGTNRWRELSVPMADRLEFASLVERNGSLAVVGGTLGGGVWVWELGGDGWRVVGEVPLEMGIEVFGDGMSWEGVKCVGYGGVICLYRDLGSGFITWRSGSGVNGAASVRVEDGCGRCGVVKELKNGGVKGLLMHPKLSRSVF